MHIVEKFRLRFYAASFGMGCILTLPFSAHCASLTPVTVTGFNRDVVIENTVVALPAPAAATNFNAGENTAFYQVGFSNKTHGLPIDGRFTNAVDGSIFQLQSYTASNALVFSTNTPTPNGGTLTLSTPAMYSRLAVIAHSGNGDPTGSASIAFTFNDNSTYTNTYYAPDWFNNSNGSLYSIALQGFDRINLSTGAADGSPSNPRFYQTTLNLFSLLGATNKPIKSITFSKPATPKSTGIYAVSGLPNSSVTLPTVINLPASNILSTSATVAGQVTSTGDETPVVTVFYGTNNGGTTASAWSNSVTLGYQSGVFTLGLSGLTSGRTYFYTARAVNFAGTNWASPSQSFVPPVPSAASVTNLPASSVTASTASLNGQVLATGGDPPSITIYYGPTDGGSNPNAWANKAFLGVQTALFSKTVFNLASNANYFFTSSASNANGIAFATPSRAFTTASTMPAPIAMYTQHNDNNRSGENLNESALNAANVNTNTFGLVYTRPVDDQIYAQPLVATNITVPGKGVRNLLLVATVNNSVYAFDADDSSVVAPYWQVNYNGIFNGTNVVPPRNTDMTGACGGNYRDFSGQFGIVGTPVIDPATKIMYFVSRTKEYNGSVTNFVQRLYAIDVAAGTNRISPVIITGSFAGGLVTFDPQRNNQRAALTLANGNIFIGWSSHCDWGPYHGWVMAYNASTLAQVAVYCDTPTGSNGGIWMSGQGPAADSSGNIYLAVGNGSVGVSGNASDPTNRGMSFLKLNGANLSIMSWFTPYNWNALNAADEDLGAGGLLLIPGTSFAIGGGKTTASIPSYLYLVNRDSMGNLTTSTTTNDNILQNIPVTPTGIGVNHIHGAPVWWDAADGSYLYVWGESDRLHQYKFDKVNNVFLQPVYSQSPTPAWVNGMTGGMLSISANGTNAGTGILWGSHQFTGDANQAVRPGILHAYDAQNVTNELWNSEMFSARDSVGSYAKFVPPTVANGKVYLATFSNRVNVYGLLPAAAPVIYQQPQTTTRFAGDPVTISVAAGGGALSYQWKLNNVNIPGATTANYLLNNVQFTDAGNYTCVITNGMGTTNTAAANLSVLTSPTISYVQTVLSDSPIAYWRLDETNGTVAHDFWGGHDGQYISAGLGQPGFNPLDSDTAASFGPGPDSYVGNIQGIDFSTWANTATFSVEAWVNAGAQVNGAGIVTYGYGGGGEQFNLDTGGSGNGFRFAVRDAVSGSGSAHNASSAVVPNNTWQHLVGVCDEPNGVVRLYVNGASVASTTVAGGIEMGTSPISIGARQANFGSTYTLNFVGSIDEVAIYNHALSAAQVLNHYIAGTNSTVALYLQKSGNSQMLLWSPGILQAGPTVGGPFTNVPSATSPYTLSPTDAARFFRVKVK